MEKFISELKYNQKINFEKGLENRIDIDYVIKRLEEINILGMYDLVFQDMVKCYIEDNNYVGNEDNFIELNEREIKEIAKKLIYKSEYMWEVINETIDVYVGLLLQEKERKINDDK